LVESPKYVPRKLGAGPQDKGDEDQQRALDADAEEARQALIDLTRRSHG
jgi:hypothetical protein